MWSEAITIDCYSWVDGFEVNPSYECRKSAPRSDPLQRSSAEPNVFDLTLPFP